MGRADEIFAVIQENIKLYASGIFEKVCQEFLGQNDLFPLTINKLGRWWQKDAEIDIVGLDEVNGKVIFSECKWEENLNAVALCKQLQEKSRLVDWKRGSRGFLRVICTVICSQGGESSKCQVH
jgi:hypothetical protein